VTVLVPLLMLVVTISVFRPAFFAAGPLTNVVLQASFFGMMALVVVFLLSMGELDISVGAIYALTSIVAAVLMDRGLDPWLAVGAGILTGMLGGALNAVLGNLLRIPMVVVTLGTISVYRGLTILLPSGRSFSTLPTEHPFFTMVGGDLFGIPIPVWVFVAAAIVLQWVYSATRFGYVVRAIGSNPNAARLSGISIERARLSAEILMGAMCGLAGILTLAYLRTTDPLVGTGYEILVIAAAIIGGTALSGGSGSVIGALFGAVLISVIRTGLTFFGVTSTWTAFVTGAVIVGAVAIDTIVRRRRSGAT
jgi:ribose transport system permease protein